MTGELEPPIQSVLSYIEQRTIHALEHQERSHVDRIHAKAHPILWWQIFNALIVLFRAKGEPFPEKVERATKDVVTLIEKLLPETEHEEILTQRHFAYGLLAFVQQETTDAYEYGLRLQHLSYAQMELIYLTDQAIRWIQEHD